MYMMTTKWINRTPWHLFANLVLVYFCYAVCRIVFVLENSETFTAPFSFLKAKEMIQGGLLFDTSAICYTNCLYILLALLPIHHFGRNALVQVTRWLFVLPNAICILVNLIDTVYFSYTQRRITVSVFSEFGNENNLSAIFAVEAESHWYLILLAVLLVYLLWKCWCRPQTAIITTPQIYYVKHLVALLVIIPLTICGIRGAGLFTKTRPITISNALQYVEQPLETNIVLNTPFAILRTMGRQPQIFPSYFADRQVLDSLYSPIHFTAGSTVVKKKNVVVLIVESFAQEFVGALNTRLDGGTYRGYTPFVDSLLCECLTFSDTFCNSWTSIDAMPAILASIPKIGEPFVLTSYSLNKLTGLAGELKSWGYQTAFFHGAENGSMGFQAFSRAIGFSDYYGRDEFNLDSRFGGNREFDGIWAVWDEPFLQYFCLKMTEMREPFITSVFTASSHHPFHIPDQYKDVFVDEGKHRLHKCIRYTDYALRRFFETASRQPWYANTIFVLTADHASSKTTHVDYQTGPGLFRVPIFFFDPSGEMPRGMLKGIAQHIDIMPTLLGYLGYDKPYIAFGKDLLHVTGQWAINWYQLAQYIQDDYLLVFDGEDVKGIYNYHIDPALVNNLKGSVLEEEEMEQHVKAFLQSYSERMESDQLTVKP